MRKGLSYAFSESYILKLVRHWDLLHVKSTPRFLYYAAKSRDHRVPSTWIQNQVKLNGKTGDESSPLIGQKMTNQIEHLRVNGGPGPV